MALITFIGIHGLPLQSWPSNAAAKEDWYCAHGKATFPTWHTPYMLLYEQRIYEEMRALIPTTFAAEDQNEMIQAADTWRLPFWDWAMKKPTWNPAKPDDPVNRIPGTGPNVPFIVTQQKVQVRTKTGTAAPVDNPMFHFAVPTKFGDYGVANDDAPWVG